MTSLDILNDDVVELNVDGISLIIVKFVWGGIKGNINDQKDLKEALDNMNSNVEAVEGDLVRISGELENKANADEVYSKQEVDDKLEPYVTNLVNGKASDSIQQTSSIAGSGAFKLVSINQTNKTCLLETVEGIEVGDEASVYVIDINDYDTNYMLFGKVISISGNTITFDTFFNDSTLQTLKDGSYLWIMGKPNIGDIIIGEGAVAEGFRTNASQIGSHSEGIDTLALGKYAHAEGRGSKAVGYCSHAEGRDTIAKGQYAHAEGRASEANGDYSLAAIQGKANGNNSLALGTSVNANGDYSFVAGHGTTVDGDEAIALGHNNNVSGNHASSIGTNNTVSGQYASALNYNNIASGNSSSALGKNNKATGEGTLVSGIGNEASGYASSASGTGTKATGNRAKADGYNCEANGTTSYAGGASSKANHTTSFVHGTRVTSSRIEQVVFGRDNADNPDALLIIGDGANENNKHNAFEVLPKDVKSNGISLEKVSNKTTAISSSSTHTEYPSAKAVYDYIQSLLYDGGIE